MKPEPLALLERTPRARRFPAACAMVFRDSRVELGDGLVHLLCLLVLADEIRDLLHLADEAMSLSNISGTELGDERRMAAIELGAQLVGDAGTDAASIIIEPSAVVPLVMPA